MSELDIEPLLKMEADIEVMRLSISGPIAPTEERRQSLAQHLRSSHGQGGHWTIELDGRFIGWVSLTPLEGEARHQIAYRLCADAWGKGYATEAATALMSHGFDTLGLQSIVAVVRPENTASQRVLQKLGFAFQKEALHDGVSVRIYSISSLEA